MKQKIGSIILLTLIFLVFFISINTKYANATEWLEGWTYRKSHIVNSATGSGTDYQVKIIIINGSSSDSGNTVYINNKMNATFGDIRFTDNDGDTLLNYWMESLNSGLNATFWVKITDSLESSNQEIYIYYGNIDVSTTSNGVNTFVFFDNFDDASLNSSLWTSLGGTPTESGGEVVINTSGEGVYSTSSFINERVRWRGNQTNANYAYWGCSAYNDLVGAVTYTESYFIYADHISAISNNGTIYIVNLGSLANTYNLWEILWVSGSRSEFTVNDTSKSTHTTYVSSNSKPIKFYDYASASILTVDWIFVSKYVYPEPAHSIWGDEEQNISSYIFNGTIIETFTISSKKTVSFSRYGKEIFNLQSLMTRTELFYRYVSVNTLFSVLGEKSILFQPSGLIIENFIVEGFMLKGFLIFGKVNLDFSIKLTNYYWALVTFAFDYSMLIVLLFLFSANIILCIKRVPLISVIIGIFTIFIGAYNVNDTTIPLNPTFCVMLCVVGVISILINSIDLGTKRQK